MSVEISREPWPESGIEPDTSIDQYKWGYLVHTEDGKFRFETEPAPDPGEIIKRWGPYLTA